jgi:penicillin-binding protein 1A
VRALSSLLWVSVAVPVLAVFAVVCLLVGGVIGAILGYSDRLPEIPELANYRPKTVSTFYSDHGTVIGIFYKQKRFVIDPNRIPFHVSHAFIAAEDCRFFQHNGVDWKGIARAAYKNAMAGRIHQGASTITQQVARNVLLNKDRKISRKIKEMLLARKIEKLWGKKKILHVYLNEIYLGDHCYGIEAAARNYFGKHVEELSIGEAALLAGIVPGPSRYNPFKNRKMSLIKQRLVLGNMLKTGVIAKAQYQEAMKEELKFRTKADRPFDMVPDFTEAVRRYVIKKYGKLRLYHEGLKVYTTCRLEDQQRAFQALKKGLDEIKDREKRHIVVGRIERKEIAGYLAGRSTPTLSVGHQYQGVVTRVGHSSRRTRLSVALDKRIRGFVDLPKRTSAYKVGHVLSLELEKYRNGSPVFVPAEDPPLQGALVCIENGTGYVRALVGGSSRDHFQFNRATQARRQPGSTFKPIIYAAALEQFGYTPATVIVDEPVVIELTGREEEWSPNNADRSFLGPISLRRALQDSRNICTIKILMDIGFDPVIQLARRMGIRSKLEKNLSLCLGTSEASLYDLTAAYSVFPNGGSYLEPVLVKKIEDRYGNTLEDNTRIMKLAKGFLPVPSSREQQGQVAVMPYSLKGFGKAQALKVECPSPDDPKPAWPTDKKSAGKYVNSKKSTALQKVPSVPITCPPAPPRVERPALSAQTAYIMTSLLQGVVRSGTGSRLSKYLKRRDLCGKTGTTDNSEDAWFIGYNRNYTTGVWVGFDDNRPLGRRETGARAALPIWAYFMDGLLKGVPQERYPVPEKLVRKSMATVVLDKETGPFLGTVVEPVYAPLSGKALTVSPLDSFDAIQVALAEADLLRQQAAVAGTPHQAVFVPNQYGQTPVMYPSSAPPSPQHAARGGISSARPHPQPTYPLTWPGAGRQQPVSVPIPVRTGQR